MRGWPDNFKKPLIFTVLGRGIRSRKAVSDGGVEPGIWTFVLGAAGYPLAPAVPDAAHLEKKLLAYGLGQGQKQF